MQRKKMDEKTWLWRKRSSEKLIAAKSEAEISIKGNQEEKLPHEKEAASRRTVKDLHDKVASLLSESNAKDELMARHANIVKEAYTGRQKVPIQEPENMLQQTVAASERWVCLNAALKDCRQQLSSLESKYAEARKKLVNLTVENARLTKALVTKEEIIEDVSNQMSQATAEFNEVISRLDSTKRGNDVLKYEYHVLERELDIRNCCADMENRKHQESAKRVAKLVAERHRLRLLARKRIPGHAKTKPNNHPKVVDRRMSLVVKRLCEVEEENKILKESARKRDSETSLWKTELEHLKEWKRTTEDHFESLKLINVDLDHQLSVAEAQITEALQKASYLEMELEDRSHRYEELEATSFELQLELASVSIKDVANKYIMQEERLLQTGLEATAELTKNKGSQHSSSHDHMAMEDVVDMEDLLNPSMPKENISTTKTKEPPVPRSDTCNNSYGLKRCCTSGFGWCT